MKTREVDDQGPGCAAVVAAIAAGIFVLLLVLVGGL